MLYQCITTPNYIIITYLKWMESNNRNMRWDPGGQANDKTDKNIPILPVKIRRNWHNSLLYLAKCHYILGFDLFLKCLLMFCWKSCTLQEYTYCMDKCRVSCLIFRNLCNNALPVICTSCIFIILHFISIWQVPSLKIIWSYVWFTVPPQGDL